MEKKTSFVARLFAKWAQDSDTDPEDIAEAVDSIMENGEEEPETEESFDSGIDLEAGEQGAAPMPVQDNGNNAEIIALLKQVIAKLSTGAPAADPVKQLTDELAGNTAAAPVPAGQPAVPPQQDPMQQDENSVTIPPEDYTGDEDLTGENPLGGNTQSMDSAATIAAINAMKPYIVRMKPKEQAAAVKSIRDAVYSATGRNRRTTDGYSAILNSQAANARARAAKAKAEEDESALGEAIMKARNAHYNK